MDQRPPPALDALPSRSDLLSRSGLEFMQAVLAGDLLGGFIWQTMGFWLHEVEQDRVVFQGQPELPVTNPMRGVHGGWYGTILDSCMACAVMTRVPKGSYYTTLEYKINITRALPLGTLVAAEGLVQHAGRSTAVSRGEIRGVEDGKLYATGATTCLIMSAE